MADMMQFDLVSPERKLASGQAREVQIPGAAGDMTAMPNHAPLIATLRPGLLSVSGSDGISEYVVTGGFVEITPEGVSVLAERAVPRTDVTQELIDGLIADAKEAVSTATADKADDAAKALADVVALAAQVGLGAKAAA